MKIIIIALCGFLLALPAVAQQTRCVKNWDGSYTCTTTRGGGF